MCVWGGVEVGGGVGGIMHNGTFVAFDLLPCRVSVVQVTEAVAEDSGKTRPAGSQLDLTEMFLCNCCNNSKSSWQVGFFGLKVRG